MIREELLHPIIVHFPLAFLATAPLFKVGEVYCLFSKNTIGNTISNFYKLFLGLGFLGLVLSLFLGDTAAEITKNQICDLTLLYQHEEAAHNALYLYISAGIFELLQAKFRPKWMASCSLVLLFVATYFLLDTAHLGGELVYEHGAAVMLEKASSCH
jgi:uncharacterized membrane protein